MHKVVPELVLGLHWSRNFSTKRGVTHRHMAHRVTGLRLFFLQYQTEGFWLGCY